MRISRLELLAYGPFRGVTLDFSAPGIHVVLGRNEAGKSTTLRAISGLLYGIDLKTPDAHVHKFSDLRIGGVLENGTGERIRVVRRKGNTNTLLDEREQPMDESVLKRLLGGVSKETFTHAFGLDHGMLEAGAKALLEGKGDLGESLFDASVGGGGEVQRLLAELSAEAERIYKPRASSLPLNDALKSFSEAQKSVREKQSLPEAFVEQERGLRQAMDERAARLASKKELETRKARLERALRRVPLERRRERALERRAELGAVHGQTPRVAQLKERFVAYERALEQRRALVAETERLAERVAEAARRAGVEPSGCLDALRLDARKEARVHALLSERTSLLSRIEAAHLETARLERERSRLSALAPASPSAGDSLAERDVAAEIQALASALERARALGDIEVRLATEASRLERRTEQLQSRVATLGSCDGTLDAFVALRLPAMESVERLEAQAGEYGRVVARLEERATDLEREAASIEKQIAGHVGDFAPPDAATLRAARDARDDAWRAARAEVNLEARRALEVDVERLLREADAIADRMIREADRVTTLARLRSEAETNARQRERITEEKARAERDIAAVHAELEVLFADSKCALGLRGGFSAARQWLERHAQIAEAYGALREARANLLDEQAKVRRIAADLASALARLDAAGTFANDRATVESVKPEAATSEMLAELVARAATRLTSIEAARREASTFARALAEVETKLDERAAVRARDEAALTEVGGKLRELLSPLGIPADASAEEVNRSIEAMRELFGVIDKRADAEARTRRAGADVRAFEADLARAISELAPDLGALDLRDAAPALFARGVAAQENAQELAAVEEQLDSEGELALDDAERALVMDRDAAHRAVDELAEEIDEVERETTRLTERIGGLRNGLEEMRADSHAAEAAATAQIHLARVRENVERWCRVKLAAVLLAREIERYREENQGPLLAASSALFSRLTLGSFSGIKAGFDDKDKPCLRCVRAGGTSEVDVTGLSDGTRDQLYLSLRLASLLRRADVAEPMPLVLDDVLIQLDDQRAAAALSVLAEVSQRMQVLFFTHHARLVELARASLSKGELVVHELVSGPYAMSAASSLSG